MTVHPAVAPVISQFAHSRQHSERVDWGVVGLSVQIAITLVDNRDQSLWQRPFHEAAEIDSPRRFIGIDARLEMTRRLLAHEREIFAQLEQSLLAA
jgi:hypothetical protein